MLYKATEPPPPPSDLALFKLAAHAAGDHLMPEGQALHLRRARDAVLRLLTVVRIRHTHTHTHTHTQEHTR